jgi:hypothetical protein
MVYQNDLWMKMNVVTLFGILMIQSWAANGQELKGPVDASEQQASPQKSRYNQALADALYMQLKADSLGRLARDKRIQAREIPDETMKKELAREAGLYENEAKRIQAEADQLFAGARKIRESEELGSNGPGDGLSLLKTINGIRIYQYNMDEVDPSETDIDASYSETSGIAEDVVDLRQTQGTETVSSFPLEEIGTHEVPNPEDEFNVFEASPYSDENPYPLLTLVEEGLVYRIQLGVYSSPAPFDAFAGIVPVYVERNMEGNLFKYYAGLFHNLQSVNQALARIRGSGFPDAFVVAFFNGQQISTEKAREIEYADFKL